MSKQDIEDQEPKSSTDLEDLQRRQLLTKAAKLAAYTTSTITILAFMSTVSAQVGSPPDPPCSDPDHLRKNQPKRR